MEFNLSLRLGNEALSAPTDVAAMLRRVASALSEHGAWSGVAPMTTLKDANGNTVGAWEVDTNDAHDFPLKTDDDLVA